MFPKHLIKDTWTALIHEDLFLFQGRCCVLSTLGYGGQPRT